MPKIVLLPLDERPCNLRYPHQIFDTERFQVITPDMSILGQKKVPANMEAMDRFLEQACMDAQGLVVSMDMLLYGGLVPSRLHHLSKDVLYSRFDILNRIKKKNPTIKIFAFDLIMRCPQYSSNDEEPDYYGICGLEIFKSGFIGHKIELGIASEDEKSYYQSLEIKDEYLHDYLSRRDLNLAMNRHTLSLVHDGIIDFLIIPQDDAAQYGYTAKNQEIIKQDIDRLGLALKVYMYPGADEAANTLLSRMYLDIEKLKPKFYIQYPTPTAAQSIPLLEDRYLDVTVRYQIRAAGGRIVSSYQEADIVLFVNASGTKMASSSQINAKRDEGLRSLRNLTDFVELMDEMIHLEKKVVAVADVATLNGSDHELMQLMKQKKLLLKLGAYAGWNTSSNTLGTTIPHAIQTWARGVTQKHFNFLLSRYVEDYGYMALVRGLVNGRLKELNMNYFDVSKDINLVVSMIESELKSFVHTYLDTIEKHLEIESVWMPWKRMFEVGVEVTYKP